jgi:hypothetical protein
MDSHPVTQPGIPPHETEFNFVRSAARQCPKRSGRAMAYECAVATGEYRSKLSRSRHLDRVPDKKDAAM